MNKKIDTILIVGLGSIGRRHVDIVKKNFPKIKIIALRHKKCDQADVNLLGLDKCVTSIDAAMATNPQLAIIANPASQHIKISKVLAAHGVDLMVEKPLSTSAKEVKELIDISARNNTTVTVGYNLRYLPSLIFLKNSIQSDLIGNIYSIKLEVGQYLPSWRPNTDYRRGVSGNKSLGGGVLLELSHEIDYLSWIFGPIAWVKSHVSKQSDLEIDVNDSASIICGFNNIKNKEIIASLNMDFIRHDSTRKCCVIGENGTLCWNGITGNVSFFSKDNADWLQLFSSSPDRNYTYTEQIKAVITSVELGQALAPTAEHSLQTQLVIEAIEESSLTDTKVWL